MKKLILSAIAVIAFANANAQEKGFYVKLQTGYNFSTNSQVFENRTTNNNLTVTENVYGSFGKGLNIDIAPGYMFNKYIGAELGINYLMGGKIETEKKTNTSITNSITKTDLSAKMFQVRPTLVLTGGFDKINPYAKFGVIFGFGTKITVNGNTDDTTTVFNTTTKTNTEKTNELSGNTSIGFNAATGLEYNLNDKLSLFGEITLQSLSYSPNKDSITKYNVNGKDSLGNLRVIDKDTEYSDSVTTDNSATTNVNAPRKALAPNIAFSSIGINVGVKYKF